MKTTFSNLLIVLVLTNSALLTACGDSLYQSTDQPTDAQPSKTQQQEGDTSRRDRSPSARSSSIPVTQSGPSAHFSNIGPNWWMDGQSSPVDRHGAGTQGFMVFSDPRYPQFFWQMSLDPYVNGRLTPEEQEKLRTQNAIAQEKLRAIEALNREIFSKVHALASLEHEISSLSRAGESDARDALLKSSLRCASELAGSITASSRAGASTASGSAPVAPSVNVNCFLRGTLKTAGGASLIAITSSRPLNANDWQFAQTANPFIDDSPEASARAFRSLFVDDTTLSGLDALILVARTNLIPASPEASTLLQSAIQSGRSSLEESLALVQQERAAQIAALSARHSELEKNIIALREQLIAMIKAL